MIQNNVIDYLESTAKKFPDNIAVVSDENRVTFKEFKEKAQMVGVAINNNIKSTNKPILVAVERSHKSLIGFFGVIYSGNYYVPIDANSPIERLNYIIEEISPVGIITLEKGDILQKAGESFNIKTFLYDDFFDGKGISEKDIYKIATIKEKVLDANPCYVLYTSGSTGNPKGVVISHRNVIDLTEWLQSVLETRADDVIGNQTPFFFDASVKDIYQMLKTGATLVILKPTQFTFTKDLIEYLNQEKVTITLWASSAVTMVANSGVLDSIIPEYMRIVTFAGEQLFTNTLNIWMDKLPNVRYINLYGPTETTVDCLFYEVDRSYSDDEIIPLGSACFNKEVLLLNEKNEVITEGIGEIAVRGTGVGSGYYGNEEKTSEVYIQNPSHNLYRDIIYKTGDLAYYNDEGLLVFASRKDNQIKLHGHRIELGEIEFALSSIKGLDQNVCLFDAKNEVIIAFYTGEEKKRKEINSELIQRIPKYMLPAKYVHLKFMPMTNNGKIDRKKIKKEYLT